MKIRIATRGSKLARAQATQVQQELKKIGFDSELVIVKTAGDQDKSSPLQRIGGNGLFVREIEKSLLEDRADIAVHSAKDLPFCLADGMKIAYTPRAADFRDLIILKKGVVDPAEGASSLKGRHLVIGTSSPRRICECASIASAAIFRNLRGNITTRLSKIGEGYDGIILAKAGLDRIQADLSKYDILHFEPEQFTPACNQGIIAVECRESDQKLRNALGTLNDEETFQRFEIERYMFRLMNVDCTKPAGVYAEILQEKLKLHVMCEGKKRTDMGDLEDYKEICRRSWSQLRG